jgi:uncharacterized protein (TIGR02246 family)
MSVRSRIALAAALTVACTSGAWAQDKAAEKASPSAVRAAIEAVNAKFTAAVMAGDANAAGAVYSADAVVLAPNTPAMKGRAAIAGLFKGWLSEMTVSDFSLTADDVISAGDYVIETGTYRMTMQLKAGGAVPDQGKYLVVWKRENGEWKIHRDAWNTDAPPPTGK